MRVIFFGAGNFAKNVWEKIEENGQIYQDDYLAFADNNPDLWGKHFCNRQVIAPADIKGCGTDFVVITSIYECVIRNQLIKELGVPNEKIYSYAEYARKCYAEWIYRKRYSYSENLYKHNIFNTNRIVIYTAITGDYDKLREPLFLSDALTYVCITNNPNIKSEAWNIEYVKNSNMDNVHLARHIKMNPHIFFREYETSVWVDGKYQIMDDFITYILKYAKQSNILCFPHPERECICDEMAMCVTEQKGSKKGMILQVADYLRNGYPLNSNLYETGCLVRGHNDEQVQQLMKNWERELLKYSIRDQLSFPYVCWKMNYEPDICDLDVNRNQWLLQKRTLY